MSHFGMPKIGSWEERGGWVVTRLAADIGLSLKQSAGVVGNLGYESRGFTELQEINPAVPGSRGGAGWAQWTGPRRVAFETWCSAHHLGPASDEANYRFLVEELNGSHKQFTDQLKKCISLEAACRLTHRVYEAPKDALNGTFSSQPDRLKWARRALAGASADIEPAPPDPIPIDRDLVADLVRALQRYLDVEPDGHLGPKTIAAVQKAQRRTL